MEFFRTFRNYNKLWMWLWILYRWGEARLCSLQNPAKPTYSILPFVVGSTGQFPRSFHLRGRYMTLYEKNLKYCIFLIMVFCYQNCSDLLWEKIVLALDKTFWSSRLKAKNLQIFEITRTIYSNCERSEQILVTKCFFNLLLEISQVQ